MDEIDVRVSRLEARVSALEDRGTPSAGVAADPEPTSTFWLLDALRRQGRSDAVVYGGIVSTPDGPVEWQMSRDAGSLREQDWSPRAGSLAAIASPVRLLVLQACLSEPMTAARIGERTEAGTTGGLYHHLQQLVAAGWLAQPTRGRYSVPPERVVPLLTILLAVGVTA